MHNSSLILASILLLATAPASAADKWPGDVADFISASESCQHWQGEEAYDADRAKEINDAVAKSCTGLDKRLALLKKRYATNRKVTALLGEFDVATGLSDKSSDS